MEEEEDEDVDSEGSGSDDECMYNIYYNNHYHYKINSTEQLNICPCFLLFLYNYLYNFLLNLYFK